MLSLHSLQQSKAQIYSFFSIRRPQPHLRSIRAAEWTIIMQVEQICDIFHHSHGNAISASIYFPSDVI